MLIVKLLVNENLMNAESAFNQADSGNLIELCRQYLVLLNNYCDELTNLRGLSKIGFQPSALARELAEQIRKAIRAAIEITRVERNLTESLLNSFISISECEAVDTFNHLQYKGFANWELQSGGIRSQADRAEAELMTIPEAVATAGRLRREAYITQKIAFLK
jgi:hypothetical protein